MIKSAPGYGWQTGEFGSHLAEVHPMDDGAQRHSLGPAGNVQDPKARLRPRRALICPPGLATCLPPATCCLLVAFPRQTPGSSFLWADLLSSHVTFHSCFSTSHHRKLSQIPHNKNHQLQPKPLQNSSSCLAADVLPLVLAAAALAAPALAALSGLVDGDAVDDER
ncbi:hypothetical protein EDB80DRAFT_689867 [Ilyonectria destructans]|nr:hypothetical protein EDB80DRAFT_689867 [Ilyonectria destructans]